MAHFSRKFFDFFRELSVENDRTWFNANKDRYEAEVVEPLLAFIGDFAPKLKKISPHYLAIPKKVGGSMFRIHRDTRFSKDKTPYKTHASAHFRHARGKDVHAPGFYLHLSVDEGCFVGVGMWHPEASALAAVRAKIVAAPAAWKKAQGDAGFRACFDLAGDALKRPPRGFAADHPYIDDLRRTDHIAMAKLTAKDVIGPGGVARVGERFAAARPYAKFLTEALDLPF